MSIDAAPTIAELEAAIAAATGAPTTELADAGKVLASLKSAASAYLAKFSKQTIAAYPAWKTTYEGAFTLLDRRARYVLSLTTTAPAALTFDAEQAAHDALVTRANTARASGAPAVSRADLVAYRTTFDEVWAKKPTPAVHPGAVGSKEETALTTAVARAEECVAFLAWATSNPT